MPIRVEVERESINLLIICVIGHDTKELPGFLGGVVRGASVQLFIFGQHRRGLGAGLTFLAETQNFWVESRVQPSQAVNTNRQSHECGLEIIPQVNRIVTVIVPFGPSSLSFVHLTQSCS